MCADDIGAAELFARYGAEFAEDDIILGLIVSTDRNMANGGLRTFHDADLKIDRIIIHCGFYRIDTEEEITVILVETSDIAAFCRHLFTQSPVQQVEIIDIPFLDA